MAERIGIHTAIDRISDDALRQIARIVATDRVWDRESTRATRLFGEYRLKLATSMHQIAEADGVPVAREVYVAMTPDQTPAERRQNFLQLLAAGARLGTADPAELAEEVFA
jgi:hypothetical protein